MHRSVEPPELIHLRQCWAEWTRIVELFAQSRPARRRVEENAYQNLRTSLLAACRGLAETGPITERAFYQSLEGVVQPWLTLAALERAEREILGCLLAWCQTVQAQLWGGRDPAQRRRRLWRLVVGLTVAPAIGIAIWLLVSFAPPVLEWFADRGYDLLWAVRKSTARQRWLAGGIILVLGAIWLVSWRQRR